MKRSFLILGLLLSICLIAATADLPGTIHDAAHNNAGILGVAHSASIIFQQIVNSVSGFTAASSLLFLGAGLTLVSWLFRKGAHNPPR